MIDDDVFREEVEVSLRQATDGQLARIMQFIDRLPSRAHLDELVAPVRGRLALARPARSVTPARVLTAPMEDLLVDPACETASPCLLPRDVLAVFHRSALDAVDPGELDVLEDEVQGAVMDDAPAVVAAGRRLWPAAAAALRRRIAEPAPADPEARRDAHAARLPIIVLLLEHAEELIPRLAGLPARSPAEPAAGLSAAEAAEAAALMRWAVAKSRLLGEAVAMILMRRLGDPAATAEVACGESGIILRRAVADCLREAELTAALLRDAPALSPFALGEALPRLTGLLGRLADSAPRQDADFAARLAAAQADARKIAAARYDEVSAQVLACFSAVVAGEAGEDDVATAEALCRAAAKIAAAGRSPGDEEPLKEPAASRLADMRARLVAAARRTAQIPPEGRGAAIMQGLRLIEILFGPDCAEAIFDEADAEIRRSN
jgi:hypothetical protein